MSKLFAFFLTALIYSCNTAPSEGVKFGPRDITRVLDQMTALMVHDVTNPPLAARFFSYACLAGYEVVAQNDRDYRSMHGLLNQYPVIKKPDTISGYNYQLSAMLAMMETAKKMQPSGRAFANFETQFLDSCAGLGFSTETLDNSTRYAQYISRQILAYAKADGYNKISNFLRYTPLEQEGSWYPTPPAYIAAVEPYFNSVRSFTLDSCTQFKPVPPVPFSSVKGSPFFRLMQLNYKDSLTPDHRIEAAFWDCNPFAVQDDSHLQVGLKKISPGAHWIGITGIACQKAGKNFSESLQIFSLVSIGLMDGFICCWDEKYRSNRIRPETAIRKYIDPAWRPLLQTPPFPEYLSGHSTISWVSATILTKYFGENFHYTDSVEVKFGLEPRNFDSFSQAANEAAISRFYGGIHFMDAIDNGMKQGKQVGEWILTKSTSVNHVARRGRTGIGKQ